MQQRPQPAAPQGPLEVMALCRFMELRCRARSLSQMLSSPWSQPSLKQA